MNDAQVDELLERGIRSWVITGDASVLVDRVVQRLIAWGTRRCGPPQFNLSVAYASDSTAVQAFSGARTLPMMADLRVVVVKDLSAASEEALGALVGYLGEPSPSTLLIATGSGLPGVRKGGSNWSVRLAKVPADGFRWVKLEQKGMNVAQFARDHARSLGKELGAREAGLLVETVGKDVGTLCREVEKLVTYVGEAPVISAEAVTEASCMLAEADVWALTGAIAARKADVALPLLHRLLDGGEPSHRLFAAVTGKMRTAIHILELDAMGRTEEEIRSATRAFPAEISRIRAAVGKNPPSSSAMLAQLARANQRMNSHRAGDRRVLEGLILELCRS